MKLTKAHEKAGIVQIGLQNTNGSYNCFVKIEKIDLTDSSTNFRDSDEKHVNEIDKEFDLKSVRNPLIIYSKGQTFMKSVDGRHTIKILRRRKFNVISADVFFDLPRSVASRVFYNLTMNSKRMDPWRAMESALVAEFDHAIKIKKVFDKHNFVTPMNSVTKTTKTPVDINSIDPFIQAYKKDSTGKLVSDLAILLTAFVENGRVNNTAKTCAFLRGLLAFLLDNIGTFTATALRDRLRMHSAETYLEQARLYSQERCEKHNFQQAFQSLTMPKYLQKKAA